MPHVHVGTQEALATFLMVILVGFLWRLAAQALGRSDNTFAAAIGKGMSTLY